MSTQLENRPIIQKGQRYKRAPRDTSAFMFPKDDVYRNPALLRLALGQNCTLMFNHGAGHDPATVVSAHSNSAAHAKGKSQKSHDNMICWACANCHSILDQGKQMSRPEKERAFANAMRETRFQLFVKGLIKTESGVDFAKAMNDDTYWLACWRDGLVRVA
ncbi:MAG: DUF1364 domain-containing protein [Betaproteobacteria bacterium]|jgi:cytochrome c553|nr:DUF1364 domain-containing protein [Betaproteobacteria bacterium]